MKLIKRWGFGIAVLSLLIGAGQAQAGAYDAWGYRMKVRVAGYNQAEALSNFPTLVILSTNIPGFRYSDFNSPTDGADLRFAASNLTTELNYEIEKWDTNGNSYVWVQIPAIASTNDYIYAYWSNSAGMAACTTNGSTWTNGFAAVWHMKEDAAGTGTADLYRDSTINANHGDDNVSASGRNGQVDSGQEFNGTSDNIDCGANGVMNVGHGSWEAWIYATVSDHPYHTILAKAYAGSWWFGLYNGTSRIQLWVANSAKQSTGAAPVGQWSHVAATWDGSNVRFFINGCLDSTFPETGAPIAGPAATHIGMDLESGTPSYFYTGNLDEIRLSEVPRSTNWIYTCWLNQASNNTFLAFSDVGPQSTSLAVRADPVTGLGSTSATMSGTVLQTGNAENPYVYLCWGYTDGLTNATSAWAHVEALGTNWGVGQSFSTNITGLLSGSNYSYRCYVTNSTGYDWSDTAVSFQILSLPVVTNLGATAIGGQIATLRGQITATGGETPYTWFLYWLDGSATTTTVAKGTQSGVFTTALSGLLIGSNYSYRCVASNGVGIAVSADQSFQTAAGEYIWNGGGADNNASTPANWVQGVAPSDTSDSIRLDDTSTKDMTWDITNQVAAWTQTADYNGTVTIATRYDDTFPVMVIAGDCQILGGKWTHTANGVTETYRLRASISGNLTIGAGTSLDAIGKGYGQSQGPGRGNGSNNNYLPGASHGGLGGVPGGGALWITYGSITSPTNLGSGGMTSGGGAIDLDVAGTTTLQGSLLAKGEDTWAAGAAGGSIRLITSSLSGSGVIDASAGATGQYGSGGGRIAVILTGSTSFGSIAMRAFGSGGAPGSAGTVYKETSTESGGYGTLLIDNNGINTLISTLIPPDSTNLDAFTAVIITNKAILGLNTNTYLNLSSGSPLVTYGSAQSYLSILSTNGLQLPDTWTLSGYTLRCFTNLYFGGNLTVSNGTLEMANWEETNLHVAGNLLIEQNGTLAHVANADIEAFRLALQVDGDMTINAGGAIDVTGKGYQKGQGPGRGNGQNHNWHGAACHGGLGAYPDPDGAAYWVTYGSFIAPTNLGSGGYWSGGGAMKIVVGGTTTLQGSLLAKGNDSNGMAGDAGGSIFLTTAFLVGSGLIDASANTTGQCGGGGGRIAVILTSGSTFGTITLQAFGEGGGANKGAAGTIYCATAATGAARGILTVSGNATPLATNTVTTFPAMSGTSASDLTNQKYVTLVATNFANVSILTNITMGNLFLCDDNVKLRLNGHTLTLKAVYHADWGTPDRVVYDGGEIIWDPGAGTIFSIR